jgi:hypothetical protein
MLKWFLIFTGVCALVVTVTLGACKYERAREDEQRNTTRLAGPANVAQSQGNNPANQSCDCTHKSPCWYVLLAWPEGMTVWVVILTFAVIGWQADETRKSAEATVESAKAMRDSIRLQEKAMELTVNAERPYLVISVESPSPNKFVFIAKNEGRTPARIKSIWSKPIPAVMGQPGPVPSDDETAESLISTPPQVLPTNGTCTVFYCDEHRLELMQASKFSSIYFYGRIVYFNTLETDPDRPYEITDPARNS